jgi:hypothetical protein
MLLVELRQVVASEMAASRGKSVTEIGEAIKRANAALQQYKAEGGGAPGNLLEGLMLQYFTAQRDQGTPPR